MRVAERHEVTISCVTFGSYMALDRAVRARRNAGDIAGALALLAEEERNLPLHAGLVHLSRAELLAALGRADDAIASLETALDSGCRYRAEWLRDDPGLAPLRADARFDGLVRRSAARYDAEQAVARPMVSVTLPDAEPTIHGYPLLVALHGNNSNVAQTAPYWTSATDAGWAVFLPQSGEIGASPNAYTWNDRERTATEVLYHLDRQRQHFPIDARVTVLAGFSMGALRAIALAITGRIRATGVLPVAAYLPHVRELAAIVQAKPPRNLRAYLVIGARDVGGYEGTKQLADLFARHEITTRLDERPDLGHDYPPDMAETLARALAFLHPERRLEPLQMLKD